MVGVERSVVLRLSDGVEVRCAPDADHEAKLTRDEITASVHYVGWRLSPAEVDAFADGPVTLVSDHPEYRYETVLSDDTHAELMADVRH